MKLLLLFLLFLSLLFLTIFIMVMALRLDLYQSLIHASFILMLDYGHCLSGAVENVSPQNSANPKEDWLPSQGKGEGTYTCYYYYYCLLPFWF